MNRLNPNTEIKNLNDIKVGDTVIEACYSCSTFSGYTIHKIKYISPEKKVIETDADFITKNEKLLYAHYYLYKATKENLKIVEEFKKHAELFTKVTKIRVKIFEDYQKLEIKHLKKMLETFTEIKEEMSD